MAFPFGWHSKERANVPVVPEPTHTPYDPTKVWVSTPTGDVLTDTTKTPPVVYTVTAAPVAKEAPVSIVSTIVADGKKVLSFMEKVAGESTKVLSAVETYLPSATALASLLFPQFATEIAAGTKTFTGITDLISKTIASVEQKASAIPAGLTGAQKAAEVLDIVSTTVISDLAQFKITADTAYVQSLINAIVAILNVPQVA